MELKTKFIEVVVTPNGSIDWNATRREKDRKLLEYMQQRGKMYKVNPKLGLQDLIEAGIMDEYANFTEPYKHLNQLKRK
ncbi:hypothetical protein ACE38W_04880 [Chitinophaga sp. Hz27]|uniref:hypothetical protein n=1 Tax=Chitinophaga sp. Hz27 TaxID=3347169 RepID=UPI0035E078C3